MTKKEQAEEPYLGLGYEEAEEYENYCVRTLRRSLRFGVLAPGEYFEAKAEYLNALHEDLTNPEVQLKILWLERQLGR